MAYDSTFYKSEAERIRNEIESIVEEGDDLFGYFVDNVCGSDDDGRWIIGFGVYGPSGHILACPTCITVCGFDSTPFSRETMEAMEEVMQMVG